MNAQCDMCLYWFRMAHGDALLGHCKRRAPTVLTDGKTEWPLTDHHDQCGEFDFKQEAEA